jgi:hypothetical protein
VADHRKIRAIDPVTGWRLYYPRRKTLLYYVRFEKDNIYYYKIGITTQTIKKRFAGEKLPYTVLWSRLYASGRTAYIREQQIIKKNIFHKYWGPPILKSGNSEVFTKDIIEEIK